MGKFTSAVRENMGVIGYVMAIAGGFIAWVGGNINGYDKSNEAWANVMNDVVGTDVASYEKEGLFAGKVVVDKSKFYEEAKRATSEQEAEEVSEESETTTE